MRRSVLTAMLIATVAVTPATALDGPDFVMYLGGEGVAEPPQVVCHKDPGAGVLACTPRALRPLGRCTVAGTAGRTVRAVVLPPGGRSRVVRRCDVVRGGAPATLHLGARWASAGIVCRVVLRGRGLGAQTGLSCRNRAGHGFRVAAPGRVSLRP